MKKTAKIVQWWMTPKLPREHIYISLKNRPKNIFLRLRLYFRRWFIHPIKRRIAKYYLIFLRKYFGLYVVGITGSAGKTTTKEIIYAILRNKGNTVASFENIDPVYNIPTTILRCFPKTRYLILEMGVEYPGEMDFYLWLVKPDLSVITNIYPTHTKYFKNTNGVYLEKRKLVLGGKTNSKIVLNMESNYLNKLSKLINRKIGWFGSGSSVFAENIKMNDKGTFFSLNIGNNRYNVNLPLLGKQFVADTLAAACACKMIGCTDDIILEGIKNFKVPDHRMKIIRLKNDAIIIDDSYNNNPQAAKEAIETLADVFPKKNKVLVFGDMLELGSSERMYHRNIGNILQRYSFKKIICIGNNSRQITGNNVVHFNNYKEAIGEVKKYLSGGNVILFKGSRLVSLDKLIDLLLHDKNSHIM